MGSSLNSMMGGGVGSSTRAARRDAQDYGMRGVRALGKFERGMGQYFDQYTGVGNQASQEQAALTGALGPEAQAQAYQNFQLSPALQFQQQQGMLGIDQDSAAINSLLGSDRLKALNEYGQGIAAQGVQQQIQNLGGIAGLGAQMGSTQAGIGASIAGQKAGIYQGIGDASAQSRLAEQQGRAQRFGSILSAAGAVGGAAAGRPSSGGTE